MLIKLVSPQHPAPFLAPHTAGQVYFTDFESLRGSVDVLSIVYRLGLDPHTVAECALFGCAVIEFDVQWTVTWPAPTFGAQQGMTVHGAREWASQPNMKLHNTMTVHYFDPSGGGRCFNIPL